MRYLLIIFSLVSFIRGQDFIPQNNATLNYTQIFFKWPQINNSNSYKLYFNNQESEYESNQNSIVIEDFEWNSNYSWYVCGENESSDVIDCHDEVNFNIRALPLDYPANVNILDVVSLISFVINIAQPSDNEFWAGDINQDRTLDILDIVLLIDIIFQN